MDRVDVLVIAALPEEFEAAKAAGSASNPAGPGVLQWEEVDRDGVPPFSRGEYRVDGRTRFTVALARPTQMGGRTTGPFAASLVHGIRPTSLVMCGVCAGNPSDTALGDVVIGEPVYEWDEGKRSASGFEGDHRQFRLDPRWQRAAQDFLASSVASYGDANEDEALLWFLEQLHRGQQPRNHPARSQYFPSGTWQPRLARLEEQGMIRREPTGAAVLTSEGSDFVQRRLYDDVDGPQRLPFRVLTAPMASGSAVIADPDVWVRLKNMGMRKIAAVEMEAATIATVAYEQRISWLVVKGVMDHADTKKDDRYKEFAARASAQVMFSLLERLTPAAMVSAVIPSAEPLVATSAEPPASKPATEPSTANPVSAEQQNAVRSARSYLATGAFSRNGLIEQLSSDAGDGYSVEAATRAVDSLNIDFNEQAAKSAKNYLKFSAFSRKGLIDQLSSDSGGGFTSSEAEYGVGEAGL
ncbi:Ltp family lipoprotein [Actinoplanes sp. CA-054009]